MMRRKAFTVLELLVVVLLVGILAALLFPVFARARTTPGDSKCIANVKAIATAIRMYATEYEELWPGERSERVQDYFSRSTGRGLVMRPNTCNRARLANPYLRPAVILDDYLKNRHVWGCPRATTVNRAVWIVPPGPGGDWLQSYRDHEGEWGKGSLRRSAGVDVEAELPPAPSQPEARGSTAGLGSARSGVAGPCLTAFPTGWGGTVTDSFLQGAARGRALANTPESDPPAFAQAIATNSNLSDLKLSRVGDPAKYLVCGDSSTTFEPHDITSIAFPDTCATQACGYTSEDDCGGTCNFADWEECPWTRVCGLTPKAKERLLTDAKYRKTLTRHSGGSNVGFLDGHAKWYASEFLLKHSEPFKYQTFEGHLCSCWPGNGKVPVEAGKHVKKTKPAVSKSRPKSETRGKSH